LNGTVNLCVYSGMIDIEHELRPPANDEEWRAFHEIRRKVLFENRGKVETYIENHPDDSKPGNHPLVLLYQGHVIGVIRIDTSGTQAWFRRVAIREDLQRLGHGRVLLRLAEAFSRTQGCNQARCNAAVEAVAFYERCGYVADVSVPTPANSVSMMKSLGGV
jgi:GNAT superfamily N-acetyltransferase